MDRQKRQLEDLLDLLDIQQDKVNNFRQEIEINANPEIRFQIQQRVKREVVPRLDNYRQEKAEICSEIPDELRELCEQVESLIKAIEIACNTILNTVNSSNQPSKPPSNLNKQGSRHFVGRNDKLGELHDLLQQENKAAICAVSGMGGIGKTELAVQYANHYQKEYTGGICWLQVRGADVGTQIVNYGRAYLGLTPPDDQELLVQLGYCWRNWCQGNTLIVFDDVDDYKAINVYLPPSQPQFKVVMTSRVKPGSNIRRLDLEVLSEEDSLQLLRSILGEDDDRIDEDLYQFPKLGLHL